MILEKICICRCEGVFLEEILQAIDEGARSFQGIKKRNRIGMGHCQGRTCQPIVRDILKEKVGANSLSQLQKAQAPVRPIPMGDL